MDTQTLIANAKARFNHNSAKSYLAEKYNAKLLVAEQGGLFRADTQTIAFLNSFTQYHIVIVDTFDNPVKVVRSELLYKLQDVYMEVMDEWQSEWQGLEGQR